MGSMVPTIVKRGEYDVCSLMVAETPPSGQQPQVGEVFFSRFFFITKKV